MRSESTEPSEGRSSGTSQACAEDVTLNDDDVQELVPASDREEMITANLGLARHLARRFANRGEAYDDLYQVASMGLVKSADRFDPSRGVQFSTFAAKTILGELKRHLRDRGWAVRAPRRLQELYLELTPAVETLSQELGRSPTVPELAKAIGTDEESVLEAMEAGHGYRASSIDASDRSDLDPPSEKLGDVDPHFGKLEDRMLLEKAIAVLPERERRLVQMRFYEGLTQHEIAVQIGVSQMQVSRLLTSTVRRLRRGCEGEL
jgi:RNA polymerase sigma-B factor